MSFYLSFTPAHQNAFIIIFSQERKRTLSFHCVLFIRNTAIDIQSFNEICFSLTWLLSGLNITIANLNSYYWAEQKSVMCMSPLLIQWHPKEQFPRLFIISEHTVYDRLHQDAVSYIILYNCLKANVLELTMAFKYCNESHKLAFCVYEHKSHPWNCFDIILM